MSQEEYPQAARIIRENTYMDVIIIDSVSNKGEARRITEEVEKLAENGGFKMKGWIISSDPDNHA